MTTEHRIATPGYVPAADRGSEETLSLPLAVLLHLLPGAVLMGGVLLLGPPLTERGVPYDLAHIATALLTMVPFMFGAMLLYGRAKHGRLTLRGVVLSSAGPCPSGSTPRSTCRCSRSPSQRCSPPYP